MLHGLPFPFFHWSGVAAHLKVYPEAAISKKLKTGPLILLEMDPVRSLYQMDGLSDRKLRLKPRTFLWKYCDPACPDPVSDAGKRTVL